MKQSRPKLIVVGTTGGYEETLVNVYYVSVWGKIQ
jgi:hypothetical protein